MHPTSFVPPAALTTQRRSPVTRRPGFPHISGPTPVRQAGVRGITPLSATKVMEGQMKRADHHREAERLLSEARKEQDSIRHSLILAEAQVHATLALSAATRTSPPGPGQAQTGSTARPRGPDPGSSEGSVGFAPADATSGERAPGHRYPPGEHPLRKAEERRARARAAPPTVRASPHGPEPPTPIPAHPAPRRRPEEQPQEQEPGPEGQSPAAGDPDEQDPGGPAPSFR